MPAGGSISGTALIMSAGAKSRWTNIFAGLFVAVIVLVAAPLVEMVPMPALAALLIVAGFQGLRIRQAVTVWNTGKVAGVVMGMTFAATLLAPLQYAVLLGVALSILLFVFRQSNKVVVTEVVPVSGGFPEERPAPKALPSHQLTMLLVYGSLFFAAAKSLEEMLPEVDEATRRGGGHRPARQGGDRQHLRRRLAALRRSAARPRQQADAGGRRAGRARPVGQDGVVSLDRRGEHLHGDATAGRGHEPGCDRGPCLA
ncbi:MAG: SulP family inorganic anion transporter [Anaerolineae bacterium]